MALTLNGRRTGAAARAERADMEEGNYQAWVREQRQKLQNHMDELYTAALELPGFNEFWDAIPDQAKYSEYIQMLETFIQNSTNVQGVQDGMETHTQRMGTGHEGHRQDPPLPDP